jgi:hypothetical protein
MPTCSMATSLCPRQHSTGNRDLLSFSVDNVQNDQSRFDDDPVSLFGLSNERNNSTVSGGYSFLFSGYIGKRRMTPFLSSFKGQHNENSFYNNSEALIFVELTNVSLSSLGNSWSAATEDTHYSSTASPVPISSTLLSTALTDPRLLTASDVAKALFDQMLQHAPRSAPTEQIRKSSRVRKERTFGEMITSDSFLEEVKENAEKKSKKAKAKANPATIVKRKRDNDQV